MKKIFSFLILITSIVSVKSASAQQDSTIKLKTYRVGIFAPLYLDSVYTPSGYFRYRQSFPKFIVPGVDFVNGAQVALDSMKLENENVIATIFDTRSYTLPIDVLIKNKKLDSLDLLIGSVKDAEYKDLAAFALTKNIPFISATYPNDAGVNKNPFVVIVNSTLKAHCEAIFSYLLQNHGTDKIYFCRKKGMQEDRVASYFKMINEQEGKLLLNIQTVNFDSTITSDILIKKLDSNRQSVIIGGSLDESFAYNLTAACNDLHQTYPIILIGMPNWDAFKTLQKKDDFEDFPIYYSTPYYNDKINNFSRILMDSYSTKTKGKATDMAFKGFECTYYFTKLLTKYPHDFMSHINDKSLQVFSEFNFKPVRVKKTSSYPDYFENKHLYFVKILNGYTSKAW